MDINNFTLLLYKLMNAVNNEKLINFFQKIAQGEEVPGRPLILQLLVNTISNIIENNQKLTF